MHVCDYKNPGWMSSLIIYSLQKKLAKKFSKKFSDCNDDALIN